MSAHPAAIRTALRCQARRKAAGQCIRCGVARGDSKSTTYCATCHQRANAECRNRYRLKAGIPLDMPLHQRRRNPAKHLLCLELEAAFRAALARHSNLKAA